VRLKPKFSPTDVPRVSSVVLPVLKREATAEMPMERRGLIARESPIYPK